MMSRRLNPTVVVLKHNAGGTREILTYSLNPTVVVLKLFFCSFSRLIASSLNPTVVVLKPIIAVSSTSGATVSIQP